MDINMIVGIVGLVLSIVFVFYGLVQNRRAKKEKKIGVEILSSVPIFDFLKRQKDFSLNVSFVSSNQESKQINEAFVQYVRFLNSGPRPNS